MTGQTPTMTKTKKILLFSLLCLGLVVCLSIWAVPRLIRTDLFKLNLEQYLSQQMHRQVRVTGSLNFRVYPWIGFRARGVQVANPDGFGPRPMVSCGLADVSLEPGALFHRRMVFKEIILSDARIHLVRNRYGKTNWRDLLSEKWDLAEVKASHRFILDRIEAVHLRGAALAYTDVPRGQSVSLSDLEFDRKGVVQREFNLSCRISASGPPIQGFSSLEGNFTIGGSSFVDLKKERLAIIQSHFSFPFETAGPAGGISKGEFAAGLSLDSATGSATFTEMVLRLDQSLVGGHLKIQGIPDQLSATGRIQATTEDLSGWFKRLALDPQHRWWTPPQSVAIGGTFDLDGEGVRINDLRAVLDDSVLTGSLHVTSDDPPRIQAVLEADCIDLARFLPETDTDNSPEPIPSASGQDGPYPGDWLRRVDADIAFSAGAIAMAGTDIQDLQFHLQASDGSFDFAPLTFALANGRIQSEIHAAALDMSTVVTADVTFEDLSAAAVFKMTGQKPMAEAALDGEIDLFGAGGTWAAFLETLSGSVRLRAPRGMVIYPGDGDRREKIRIARVDAVLAAYIHDGGEAAGDRDRPRSFELNLSVDALAPAVSGTLRASGMVAIDSDRNGVRGTCPEFSLRLAGKPLAPCSPLELDGQVRFDSSAGKIRIDPLSFDTMGLTGSGRILAGNLHAAPEAAGHLRLNNFDPRALFKRLAIALPSFSDPSVFQHARAESDFHIGSDHLLLSDLSGVLDDTSLSGTIAYDRLAQRRLLLRLDADRLDLDRYLPTDATSSGVSTESGSIPGADRGMRHDPGVEVELALAHLKVADIRLEQVALSANLANGDLDGRLQHAELYGGAAIGDLSMDLGASPIQGSAMLHLRQIGLEGLLTDVFGWVALTGDGSADLVIAGEGSNPVELGKNLSGQANVAITNGAIQGIRAVPDHLREKSDGLVGDGGDQEPFDSIQGTVLLKAGVLENTDAVLAARHVRVEGAGTLNLYTDILDYAIAADVTGYPLVRYTFTGPLDDIETRLDRAEFARETAVGVLKSPFRLGKGTLDFGTAIIDLGTETIGTGTGPQRMGRGALGVGRGLLGIGKGILGLDAEGVEKMGDGVREMGRGVMDVGGGVVDTGADVFRSIGSGIQKIFSSEEGGSAVEAPDKGKPATPSE
jgi:uncharacterized protein involved in outer membrane biogenesis